MIYYPHFDSQKVKNQPFELHGSETQPILEYILILTETQQ